MFRPPLLVRMIRLAPKEMCMAFISGFLAVYGVNAFNEYVHDRDVDTSYVPVIFSFGPWPYYGILLITVVCLILALLKAEKTEI